MYCCFDLEFIAMTVCLIETFDGYLMTETFVDYLDQKKNIILNYFHSIRLSYL